MIRKNLFLVVFLSVLFINTTGLGAWLSDQQKTLRRLKGMTGIVVTVDVSMILPVKNSPLGKEMDSVREDIAKALTETLCAAGVSVVSFSDWQKSEFKPVMRAFLSFSDTTFIMWLYCEDQFILQRNSKFYKYMKIWEGSEYISCPTILNNDTTESRKVILEKSKELLDDFIRTYQEANPGQTNVDKPQSPSAEEQNAILQSIGDSPGNKLEGLTCFIPKIETMRGSDAMSGKSGKFRIKSWTVI